MIHLQKNQAKLVLFDEDSLEFSGELGMICERKLNSFEQDDQRRQSLLAVDNFDHGIFVRNDGFETSVEPNDGCHEMPLFRSASQPIDIVKHVLALLGTPRIRALVLRYPKESVRKEVGQ